MTSRREDFGAMAERETAHVGHLHTWRACDSCAQWQCVDCRALAQDVREATIARLRTDLPALRRFAEMLIPYIRDEGFFEDTDAALDEMWAKAKVGGR